ncbi:serine protease filzig-like [Daphnia carinata]|uniref:serine protease filzig-like n=1 Tax=Daphnia carinata TaxID=120202 RepID=UPI00257F80FB|nr:serine protease filzig-like [Daphnia carinata]
MIAFFWLWLLLAASPLLAKSIAPTSYQEDVLEVDQPLASGRSSSLPERFLQIAHKNCQGPERQPGICMFNFECQQQRGKVVGACLDGFLFGACCHLSADHSMNAAVVSALQAVGAPTVVDGPAHSSANEGDVDSEVSGHPEPSNVTSDLIGYGSLRVPAAIGGHDVADDANKDASTPVLPLVLMFKNDSVAAVATSGETQKEGEGDLESTATSQNNKASQLWTSDVSLPITALADNQIALSSQDNPTTAGSLLADQPVQQVVLQPTASLQIDAQSSKPPADEPPTPTPATNRVPVRVKGQSNKRPRPKPSTASTKNVETTSTTAPSVENVVTTTSVEVGNVAVTESLADQQANVLQFLVSNPPAWVLDEIINGSTLTTWYPLPIAESGSMIDLGTDVAAPSVSASPGIRPLKRKPVKNRPQSTSKISPTTAPTVSQMEDDNDDGDDGEISESVTTVASITTTTDPPATSTVTTRKRKPVFDYVKDCGVRPMAPEARIVGGRRSDYGRWPWQVLIRESTWFGIFSKNKCGGVLISDRHVLTAAHCQPGFLGSLLVVLGEFDLTGHSEPNTPMEKNVKRVVVHRDYVERTFENDLAILELDSPVEFKPYIVPICLPSTSDGDFVGKKAEVTGWGKLSHNGPTPGVLYEVDVPIISNPECHDMFKKAGHEKRILDSFVCAGYSEGKKDSCEGDSGGPLMYERDDGRWSLVGTVSHGIRCAYPNMPGVYMRMTYYRPWIERVTGIGGTQLGR